MERNAELCSRIENDLPLFVGGELDPVSARELARHLEACPACRDLERRARGAQRVLVSELTSVKGEAGPDLWPGLRAQLAREGLIRPTLPVSNDLPIAAPRRAPATRRVWLAAAAAVLALLGAWAARNWMQATLSSDADTQLVDGSERGRRVREPIATQPVADGRLRQLREGEHSLQEGAATLGAGEELNPFLLPRTQQRDAPASLIQVRPGW